MHKSLLIGSLAMVGSLAYGASYFETEDNNTKALANALTLDVGDTVGGSSTGTSTVTAGSGSADYFRIRTVAGPLAVYRHRMTRNSTAAHTQTIRGLNQVAGVPGTIDNTVQTGSTVGGVNITQWYGFGKGEEIYWRVTGTTSTTAAYEYQYSRELVTVTNLGSVQQGDITFDALGPDTDFWIYDSNFDAIPGAGNDDTAAGTAGILTRTLGPGVYYIALSTFNLANNQGSPADDSFRTGNVMDFAGSVVNSSSTTSNTLAMNITSTGGGALSWGPMNKDPFEVKFGRIEVVPEPATMTAFGLGLAAMLRRRRAK